MQMLIVTDGSARGKSTAEYAALIAHPASAEVTLLGLAANRQGLHQLQDHLQMLQRDVFDPANCTVVTQLEVGDAEEIVLNQIDKHFYHLVAIGTYRRHGFFRLRYGSVARYLAQHVPTPLLIVNNPRHKIDRILICTSAESPGETDAYVGGTIGALVGAEVTILHVMSQIKLVPQAPEDLDQDASTLMAKEAREGVHLKRTLAILEENGVLPNKRVARVRHGLVVDEIVQEARERDHDLVIMGAHEVPESRSQHELRELLQENITDQILTALRRPMLIVRALDDKTWWSRPK